MCWWCTSEGYARRTPSKRRYEQINAFEKMLTENGTTILKFMLHISKEEQGERLQAAARRAGEPLEVQPATSKTASCGTNTWPAYETMLESCSTAWAPWHVIPADRKWARNAAIAAIVRETLEEMDPQYPEPGAGSSDRHRGVRWTCISGESAQMVTGGTKGIGRAIIVFGLAAEGADVAVCARDAAAVAATVEELKALGVRSFGATLDVSDKPALNSFVKDAGAALGGLDILVCNASALADGSSEEAFRQAFEIDLMHTRNACEAAMPLLERSGEGAIVAISSISGSEDYGYGSSAYGTMKAALFFYVKSLARHVAARRNPGQHRIARHHLFRRRRLGPGEDRRPGSLCPQSRRKSDEPHGAAGGDRRCRGVPVEPAGQLRVRRKCGGGRNADDAHSELKNSQARARKASTSALVGCGPERLSSSS